MANNDMKGRLDLLSLLTEELSAGETVVDVSNKTKLRYALYLRKSTDREDKQQLSRSQKKVYMLNKKQWSVVDHTLREPFD